MSAIGSVLGFLGSVAAVAYPPAVPFIAFAQRIEPIAEAGLPLLRDAIAGGPAAFAAFRAKAPDLYEHLKELAVAIKTGSGSRKYGDGAVQPSDSEMAVLGAHIVGIDPPGWTHGATVLWWDRDKASMG